MAHEAKLTFFDSQKYIDIANSFRLNMGIEMPMYFYEISHVWPIFSKNI